MALRFLFSDAASRYFKSLEVPAPEAGDWQGRRGTTNDLRKSGGEKVFKATAGNNTGMVIRRLNSDCILTKTHILKI